VKAKLYNIAMVSKSKEILLKLRWFIPLAIICTIIFGSIYVAVHQDFRQSANDPQIQLAEDLAKNLEVGQKNDSILNTNTNVDLSKSLLPFVITYDGKGNPATSSAVLSGRIPVPPNGVFETASSQGEDRFTWQPADGVRIAAVVVPYQGQTPGFVLAGRSLREVEKREKMLLQEIVAAYVFTLIVILATIIFHKSPKTQDS
jgi:sensor histidine kinase regulating citrate/malate metabolism